MYSKYIGRIVSLSWELSNRSYCGVPCCNWRGFCLSVYYVWPVFSNTLLVFFLCTLSFALSPHFSYNSAIEQIVSPHYYLQIDVITYPSKNYLYFESLSVYSQGSTQIILTLVLIHHSHILLQWCRWSQTHSNCHPILIKPHTPLSAIAGLITMHPFLLNKQWTSYVLNVVRNVHNGTVSENIVYLLTV